LREMKYLSEFLTAVLGFSWPKCTPSTAST
jgi:hypothetical protein